MVGRSWNDKTDEAFNSYFFGTSLTDEQRNQLFSDVMYPAFQEIAKSFVIGSEWHKTLQMSMDDLICDLVTKATLIGSQYKQKTNVPPRLYIVQRLKWYLCVEYHKARQVADRTESLDDDRHEDHEMDRHERLFLKLEPTFQYYRESHNPELIELKERFEVIAKEHVDQDVVAIIRGFISGEQELPKQFVNIVQRFNTPKLDRRFDYRRFKFRNEATQFEGTQRELYTRFNLPRKGVSNLCAGKVETVKGWSRVR